MWAAFETRCDYLAFPAADEALIIKSLTHKEINAVIKVRDLHIVSWI
jgi:hypothetical protein